MDRSTLPMLAGIVLAGWMLAGEAARGESAAPEPLPAASAETTPGAAGAPPAEEAEAAPLVGDPQAGAAKAAVCGACHGPDGNAPNPLWPKLAGQHPDYIAKQLRDFKQGRRTDPVMAPMAMALSAQDVADVAAYFSTQAARPAGAESPLVETGRHLYVRGRAEDGVFPCIGCHGPNGEGASGAIDGGFPAISSQNPAYLAKQLRGFRDGARANDWESVMQSVSKGLTDEDIQALAAYLSSLSRARSSEAR